MAGCAHQVWRAGDYFYPGKYRATGTVVELTAPDRSPEMLAQMKASMARIAPTVSEVCLTPEDAKHPSGKVFMDKRVDNCRYDHFTMDHGKIDALMRCAKPRGATQVVAMTGSYSPETYDIYMTISGEGGANAAGAMNLKMHVVSHRIGDCTKKERTGQ